MINTKLYNVLSILSEEEIKQLKKWVSSIYFNENEDIFRFFMHMIKIIPLKDDLKLQKETVFKKLFPMEKYDDAKMRKMMFVLLRIIEKFIVYQSVSISSQYDLSLLEFYRKRVSKEFLKKVPEFETKWLTESVKNLEYYEDMEKITQYKINAFAFQHISLANPHIVSLLHFQEIVYTIRQLKLYYVLIWSASLHRSITQKEKLSLLISQIDNTNYLKEVFVIRIYTNMIQLKLSGGDPLLFDFIRKVLSEATPELSFDEKANLSAALRNYCLEIIQKGNESFKIIRYELYSEHLSLGYLFSGNTMQPAVYRQIVRLGLELGKYKDTEHFIETYKTYLKKEDYRNNYAYCKARVAWNSRHYATVFKLLMETEPSEDLSLALLVRRLRIMALYMENEKELVIAQLNAFRVYLSRGKDINPNIRQMNHNFVHFLNSICLLSPQEPQKGSLLMEKIKSERVEEKEWLLSVLPKS
ncbi:MAG: hypothetical protein K1X92_17205 [Bacteroidia bacterium]|nr:hypothetical protein [Bacteroidia bacterium]